MSIDDKPVDATPLPAEAWLKFPPFPVPPPGKTILPFTEFKPSGIHIASDENTKELDGLGIPTVALRVRHDLTETERKKKRKVKSRTVAGPGGQVRRLTWWEEWEQGESLRKMFPNEAEILPERLYQACQEFKSGRTWPLPETGIPGLWDMWRHYIGIISSYQPPDGRKTFKKPAQEEEVEEDSDDDDVDMTDTTAKEEPVLLADDEAARKKAEETRLKEEQERLLKIDEEANLRAEKRQERKEARMMFFFEDPVNALKIFFSAHYRQKGLVWIEARLRDGPTLIGFFLRFLVRNRVFPEYQSGLQKAVDVCEQALAELPLTSKVAKVLADPFGLGCAMLMGEYTDTMFQLDEEWVKSNWGTDERESKKRKVDTESEAEKETEQEGEELKAFKASVDESNLHFFDAATTDVDHDTEILKDAIADNVDLNGVEVTPADGWGTPNADVDITNIGAWGTNGLNEDTADTSGWSTGQPNYLEQLPKNMSTTHTTGVMEYSVRRIVKITLPTGAPPSKGKGKGKKRHAPSPAREVEDELASRFAQMTVAPWQKVGNHVASEIQDPVILRDSRGPIVPVGVKADAPPATTGASPPATTAQPHDPKKDEITVLLDPAAAEQLQVGLGIKGTWVQLARIDDTVIEGAKDPSKKGPRGAFGTPTKWWYLEKQNAILTSFHTDEYFPDQD